MTEMRKNNDTKTLFEKLFILGVAMLAALAMVGASSGKTMSKDSKPSAEEVRKAYAKSFSSEKDQDYANAIKALSNVIKNYPDSYTPNVRLGWLFYLNGNYEKSDEYYQKAIDIAPSSIEALNGSMLPLMAMEDYKAVETAANQVFSIDPSNYLANLRYAYALRMQEKFDKAQQVAEAMLALYPTDVSFMVELALDKYGAGDKDGATETMWSAYVLSPDNATAKAWFED